MNPVTRMLFRCLAAPPAVPTAPHPEAERALGLLEALAAGEGQPGASEAVAALCGDARAAAEVRAYLRRASQSRGGRGWAYVSLALWHLERAGVVPAGCHPDNIPSALALRAGEDGNP